MDIIKQPVFDNVTILDVLNNPNNYPEETICKVIDLVSDMSRSLKEAKENLTGNLIRRMREDNATKRLFYNSLGVQKTATLKTTTPTLNKAIKNIEGFIKNAGFEPEQLGEYKFVPHGWSIMKEIRKQGGDIQVLCDELYPEGSPTLEIK